MIGSEAYKSGAANNLKGLLSNSTKIKVPRLNTPITAAPSSTSTIRNIKMPPAKLLKKKWGKFDRHNSLYENSMEAFFYLGRAVNSRDFVSGMNSYYVSENVMPKLQTALMDKNPDFFHMEITDKYIETRVAFPDLNATINLGGDQQRLMDAESILQGIFGSKYKTPVEWTRKVDDPNSPYNTNKSSIGDDITVVIPLEKVATLKIKYRSQQDDIKKINAEKFSLEESHWRNNFKDIASLKLTLVQSDVSLGNNISRGQSNGSLANSVNPIYIPIKAELIMRWPLEFALYATCCEKSEDFIPFIFYQYVTWHRVAYGGGRSRGGGFAANPPSRISNLGNITRRNEKEKARGRNPKIRVNEDGFTILGVGEPSKTGEVYWIPDNVNKVQEYTDQIKKAYNANENKMELYNVKLKGEGLFTDPFNDKFTYFRETGTTGRGAADISGVQTIDLTGATKLDRITIYNRITKDIRPTDGNKESDNFVWFLSLLKKYVEGDNRDAKPSKNFGSREYLESCGIPKGYNFSGTITDFVKEQIGRNIEPVTWANIGGYPLDNIINGELVSESNKQDAKYFVLPRAACNIVKGIAEDMLNQFDKLNVGYVFKLESLKFYLFLVTKYSALMDADPLHPEKLGLPKQFAKATETNSTGPVSNADFDTMAKSILAPNMPNLKGMMPHQLETAVYTKDNPSATLIEISAGGGKCGLYDTIVPTSKGLLQLGEIYEKFGNKKRKFVINKAFRSVDLNIVGSNGRDKVTEAYKGKGKTVVLNSNIGDELEFLKDHRFHVLLEDGRVDFKHVENIQIGDWLPKAISSNTHIYSSNLPTYVYNNKTYKMSEEYARILGFLVSEGYVSDREVTFTNADSNSINLYRNDWNKVFDTPNTETVRGITTYFRTHVNERKLLLEHIPAALSVDKEIPFIIRQSPNRIQKAFLKALFEGDGGIYLKSQNRWKVEYYSTSKQLTRQVKYMLENMGIFSESYVSMKGAVNGSNTKKACYTLSIAREHFTSFEKQIGFISDKKIILLESAVNHQVKDFKQNTNDLAHGFTNKLPVGKFMNKAINRLEAILVNYKYTTAQNVQRACGLSWFWKNSFDTERTEKHYQLNSVKAWTMTKLCKPKDDITTRYVVFMLQHALHKLPKNIKRNVFKDKEFNSNWYTIKHSLEHIWTKVVSKKYMSTMKPVYDIVVSDNSHSYTANGFISHNTPTSMREICQMLFEKKVKRPIVVAPGNLVRNWINEIAFFSGGKINGFALTIQSLRRLQFVYTKNPDPVQKPDYAMLKKVLDSLPPNTIIVTSYNFLGVDRENIVYGNETITRLYAAEFLRDLPCDLVAVDESHYAKNLKSNRTLGVSILESAAKYKRGLSGTTVNDSLDDLIGQAGTMVPAALGSESNFNSKYLTSAGAMKANAPVLITSDMKPYIQRIVHKRQKWASFLPRVSEQFHPVNMTPRQQEFYNSLLQNALEDLKRKNPKLAAKMIDGGDESDNENSAIERGLGIHFQSVEQFIYAPDSNAAFVALEDLEPNDLVSPKIKELEGILRNHFKGYKDSSGVTVPPDDNKVIIFSHRTKTSEHVMKHIAPEYQKIAIRYTAGDFKALQAFLKNPKIKIIIADEISINTGQNFQIASRMIRLETLWSPGDQEQALARIWRPDFKTNNSRKRIFLDWIFSNHCVSGKTWVATKEKGLVQIENMVEDELDSTVDVKYTTSSRYNNAKVSQWHCNGYKTVYEVQTDLGYKNKTTNEHKMLVLNGDMSTDWKKVKDITEKDYLVINPIECTRDTVLDLTPFYVDIIPQDERSQFKQYKTPYTMTPELAFIMGAIDSEGCWLSNSFAFKHYEYADQMNFTNTKLEFVEKFIECFKTVFDVQLEWNHVKAVSAKHLDKYEVSVFSRYFGRIMTHLGMYTKFRKMKDHSPSSYSKKVPLSIMQADKNSQLAYLASYIEGDGWVVNTQSEKSYGICSYSKLMLHRLQILLHSHGIVSRKQGHNILINYPYSITLGEKLKPYLFHKFIQPNTLTKSRYDYGIPLEPFKTFVKSRFVRAENNHFGWFKDDEGSLVKAPMGLLTYQVQAKYLRYEGEDTLRYPNFMKTLKLISQKAYDNLQELIQHRYHYTKVLSKEKVGKETVYDLSINSKQEPAYTINGVIGHNSLEVCKIGRLISKIVTKMKYDQQDNPYFTKEIFKPSKSFIETRRNYIPQIESRLTVDEMLSGSTLKLVKMSTKNMLEFNQTEQLKDYFSIYALANHWEDSEFDRLSKDPRYAKIITLPPEAYVEIEGSKTLPYYPRIPGVEPSSFDPLNKMGYKPISVVETEIALSEDDEEGEQEVNPVAINDLVDTEFGIGKVTKILDKEIWVDIRGLGEVKVPKATAWLITDEDALEQVRNDLAKAGKKGIVRLPLPISNTLKISETTVKPIAPINTDDEDEDEDESDTPQKTSRVKYDEYDSEDEDEDNELNIYAELVDGQISLTTSTEDDDSKSLLEEYDFKIMEPYVAIIIPNVQAFDSVMKVLTSKFKVMDKYVANLQFYRKYVQAKSLNTVTNANLRDTLRFFNVEMDRPIGEGYLRPFPIVWGNRFMIAFNKKKHVSANQIIRTVKAAAISGVKISTEEHTAIKFYKTSDDAIDELGLISKILTIPNMTKTVNFLKQTGKKAPEKKPLFNLNRKLDEDEDEDDTPSSTPKKPLFQLGKKPEAQVIKPTVKKAVKAPTPPAPAPVKTPAKKPGFTFNLGRGKIK